MTAEPQLIRMILVAADLSLLLFFVLLVSVGLWALRGTLPKDVRIRYPKKIAYMSQLPFTEQWRASVSAEDLPMFLTARRRQHVLLLVLLLETHFGAAYLYLHAVVDLWRCHMSAVLR
jgi:hypothetical protein